MGADPVEIEKMVKVADTDGDGEASHSNHARANWHSADSGVFQRILISISLKRLVQGIY